MNSFSPRVSVIIPNYNRERYISDTIESVLAQDFQDFEILVIDDGSNDRSPEIIQSYARRYAERVKYLEHRNHANLGVSASRNFAIQHASGEYVAFLDSDDLWLPQKLQSQVNVLDRSPEVGLVCGSVTFIDEQSRYLDSPKMEELFGKLPHGISRAFELLFPRSVSLVFSTILVRKHILFEVGLFDEGLAYQYEDSILVGKIAYHHPICVLPQVLGNYRMHDENATSQWKKLKKDKVVNYDIMYRIYRWLQDASPEFDRPEFRIKLATLAYHAYLQKGISRWGFYKFFLKLFPYNAIDRKIVKTFISLLLGYDMTNTIRKILNH